MSPLPGLDPPEEVLAAAAASFRGATAASSRGIFAVGSARTRLRAFRAWTEIAAAAGFPTAGPDMTIGVTASRLVVWRTSFLLGRAVEVAGTMPLARVAQVGAVRHGIVTGLAFVVADGTIIEVEAIRGRRLRRLAATIEAALAAPPRGT